MVIIITLLTQVRKEKNGKINFLTCVNRVIIITIGSLLVLLVDIVD